MSNTSAIFAMVPWYLLPNADDTRTITTAEAADWLRLRDVGYENPADTLANWAAHGKIPKTKLGNKVVFNLKILRAFLDMNTEGLNAKDQRSNPPTQDKAGVLGVSAQARGSAENVVIREPGEGDESAGGVGTSAKTSGSAANPWACNDRLKLSRH